jgi:hypothetical protein
VLEVNWYMRSLDRPAKRQDRNVPVLALSKQESAEALGVSVNLFDQKIARELKMVRRGRRRLVSVAEIERWLEREADYAGSS